MMYTWPTRLENETDGRFGARKALEDYSQSIRISLRRSTMENAHLNEKIEVVSKTILADLETDQKTILKVLSDNSDWLDSNQNADKEEFEAQRKALEEKLNPIMSRLGMSLSTPAEELKQYGWTPSALQHLRISNPAMDEKNKGFGFRYSWDSSVLHPSDSAADEEWPCCADQYTLSETGCPCWWDTEIGGTGCACCKDTMVQCAEKHKHRCVPKGKGRLCGRRLSLTHTTMTQSETLMAKMKKCEYCHSRE
jgi:hypothetical protein